jgi:ATP-dependent RNA helicase RhlE
MDHLLFEELNLNKFLLPALADLGITRPTAIQHKVFGPVKAGKNIVGIAQTGTGKTFAYLLPILSLWKFTKSPMPQILIMVPTRELVVQVEEEARKLCKYMNVEIGGVFGGVNMQRHRLIVSQKLDIVIGTPGRLMDLILEGTLKVKNIQTLVIDEVDEMLNLGFRTQLKNIVDLIPEKRQNLMFSATLIPEVEHVISLFSNNYEKIEAAPSGAPLENIEQIAYKVPNFNSKVNLLTHLLKKDPSMKKVLVFAGTRKMADALYDKVVINFEEKVGVIHSYKAQNNRFNTVNKFEDGTFKFIIATDIVARGLDVSGVTHVVNFDLPNVAEQYIHRIGRTGRAESKGIAISFIAPSDLDSKKEIEALMALKISIIDVPEDVVFSDELIDLEIEKDYVDEEKTPKSFFEGGGAFHEKSDKNKKVNTKIRHKDLMRAKYGKPKKRGDKFKKKK